MKKLIALMTTAILSASFITSCQLKYYDPYDEDNAQKLAIEYMKEKYDKEIEVTDTYCQKHGSDKYVGVKFKLEETDNESSDDSSYEVRVYGDKDEHKQYVKCDNYMGIIFRPYLKKELSGLLEKKGIDDYYLEIITSDQIDANDFNFYLNDFDFSYDSNIISVLNDSFFGIKFGICFPKKEFDNISINSIRSIYAPLFDDDYVRIKIKVFSDEDYEKYIIGNDDYSKNELKELKYEEIVFNSK